MSTREEIDQTFEQRRIRDLLDSVIIKNGKVDLKAWDMIWNAWAEGIAEGH